MAFKATRDEQYQCLKSSRPNKAFELELGLYTGSRRAETAGLLCLDTIELTAGLMCLYNNLYYY